MLGPRPLCGSWGWGPCVITFLLFFHHEFDDFGGGLSLSVVRGVGAPAWEFRMVFEIILMNLLVFGAC